MGELSVLYVCTHNAGRSQMAALLTESLSKGRARANSAESAPSDVVNPVAVQAMKEIGIDMSEAVPKPMTDQMVVDADVVVTMGCGDACPVIIHKVYRDWSVNDPAGQGIDTVRQVRDSVRSHVESLLLGSVVNCIFPSFPRRRESRIRTKSVVFGPKFIRIPTLAGMTADLTTPPRTGFDGTGRLTL